MLNRCLTVVSCFIVELLFFPKRRLRPYRVPVGVKEGEHTETHTKCERANGAGGPASAKAISFSFGFYSKNQKTSLPYTGPNICNGKTKGLASLHRRLHTDTPLCSGLGTPTPSECPPIFTWVF